MKKSGMNKLPENCVFHYYQLDVEENEKSLIEDIIRMNCFNVQFFKCFDEMRSAINNDRFVKENVKINAKDAGKWGDFSLEIYEIAEMRRVLTHTLNGKMMSSYCLENFEKVTYYNRKF